MVFVVSTFMVPSVPVRAAVSVAENASLSATSVDDDDDEPRFSRDRYSSSIRRKINQLDDDPVTNLPIPILLGVRVVNLQKNFGDPRDGGSRDHEGLDIFAPRGAFVSSPTEAVVTRVGKGGSAGIYVYTAGPGNETFAYLHLDSVAEGVKAGTVLDVGDLIGYVGNTGNASATVPHLHFEIRKNRRPTDPYPRLTREFTIAERIDALTEILKDLQEQLRKAQD